MVRGGGGLVRCFKHGERGGGDFVRDSFGVRQRDERGGGRCRVCLVIDKEQISFVCVLKAR